ncbi:MAG: SPOR domain-containing protein, partial [Gemmatimonadetes bacterium]|nr:SPOR domain-containing protein [Gemmatimonadota bacterium]
MRRFSAYPLLLPLLLAGLLSLAGPARAQQPTAAPAPASGAATAQAVTERPGFRIQVFADGSSRRARDEAVRVRGRLGGRQRVYVEFAAPFYKVRVGNFAERSAAEPELHRLRGMGYTDAWTVPAAIESSAPATPPRPAIAAPAPPPPPMVAAPGPALEPAASQAVTA